MNINITLNAILFTFILTQPCFAMFNGESNSESFTQQEVLSKEKLQSKWLLEPEWRQLANGEYVFEKEDSSIGLYTVIHVYIQNDGHWEYTINQIISPQSYASADLARMASFIPYYDNTEGF